MDYRASFLIWTWLIFLLWNIDVGSAVNDCTGTYTGYAINSGQTPVVLSTTGMGFVANNSESVGCCGVITSWEVLVGADGILELQVWRPETSGYKLMGENTFTISGITPGSIQTLSLSVPVNDQLTVTTSDLIGWRAAGAEIVAHAFKGVYKEVYFEDVNMPDVVLGGIHQFSAPQTKHIRYGLMALLSPGQAPTLSGLPASVTIGDDQPIGSHVYTTTGSDVNSMDTLIYTEGGTPSGLFSINSVTGEITSAITLVAGNYAVVIQVKDNCELTTSGSLAVEVTLESLKIYNIPNTTTVHEDTTIETSVQTFWIAYPGAGPSSCTITSGVPFNVRTTASDTDFAVSVNGNANLSYSLQSVYLLTISCTDSVTSLSAILTVNVEPRELQFTNLPGSTLVSAKTTASSTNVFNVTSSGNSPFIYAMTCTSCPFICLTDGRIYTTTSLTQETTTLYMLTVTVTDLSTAVKQSTLIILLTDINRSPSFTNIPTTVYVPESTSDGVEVYSITGYDADVVDTVTILLVSIEPVSGGSMFTFTDGVIKVASSAAINYESLTDYSFVITVNITDGFEIVTSQLSLVISDVNEAPAFTAPVFYLTSPEGKGDTMTGVSCESGDAHSSETSGPKVINFGVCSSGAWTRITSVDVTKKDTVLGDPGLVSMDPENNTTQYSIIGGTNYSMFSMDMTSGVISFAADYDIRPSVSPLTIQLNIQVTDPGGLTHAAILELTITHVNQPPTFQNLPRTVFVLENLTSGSTIFNISGTDVDGDALSISLTNTEATVTSTWEVDNGAVMLRSNAQLSYDLISTYNLTFTVSDGVVDSAPEILYVTVQNVNSPPTFSSAFFFMSANDGKVGDELPPPPYAAVDPDAGAVITYSLVSGNHSSYFAINSTDGVLSYNQGSVYKKTGGTATITVRATDQYGGYSEADVQITIIHVNTKPNADNLPATISIPESLSTGSWIFNCRLNDIDEDTLDYRVTFSPTFAYTAFLISKTGYQLAITSADVFDFETTPTYNLTFIANDGTEDSDTVILVVNIQDVAEPPVFSSDVYHTTVTENNVGTLVFNGFVVTDQDSGDTYSLSILSGNADDYFSMTSDDVYFNIDHDVDDPAFPATTALVIKATDSTMLTATTTLSVTISDTNDNAPIFDSPDYTKGVPYDTPTGTTILTASVSDADSGLNGDVICSISRPTSMPDLFTISNSGEIIVKNSLTEYLHQTFDFNITVTDRGSPSLSTVSMMTVIVTNSSTTGEVLALATSSATEVVSAGILDQPVLLAIALAAGLALLAALASFGMLAYMRSRLKGQITSPTTESATTGSKNAVKPTEKVSEYKPSNKPKPQTPGSSSTTSSEFEFWNNSKPFGESNPGKTLTSRPSVASLSGVALMSSPGSRRWSQTSYSHHL